MADVVVYCGTCGWPIERVNYGDARTRACSCGKRGKR